MLTQGQVLLIENPAPGVTCVRLHIPFRPDKSLILNGLADTK